MEVYQTKPVLTQGIVLKMIEGASKKAQELNIAVNIAIKDNGGNLQGFLRMDNAPLLSGEIARNKAYSSAAFGKATGDWYPSIENNPALLHGIVHTNRLTIFGGGLPIYINGQLAGGIGVSGGTADEDVIVAESGIEVLEQYLKIEK
ncbi:GlcG/HbpS family heme-binding protein [Bacillus sp. Marseille-P3661]|uniref:GlcG/HbpS family heme-binding protein n=1 Tax=Bacillus sp. Marseille-P3661 TaxID=1936234 RepID=UPI000C8576D3|nr:heme-binding protein [Bacillus sp. Marseille-P3661]